MPSSNKIIVGARSSPLSQFQVWEVEKELQQFHPHISFDPVFVQTFGDKNRTQSLRTLGKTDFFTKEIDEMLLNGEVRVAIHSAKDLPEPLPENLILIALTKGKDSRDALVMRENESLDTLKPFSKIATSSKPREDRVREMRTDLQFVDVRGTIEERIGLLQQGIVDGVVIAECALIRLQLEHLNRIFLAGKTTPLQGRLAVIARANDAQMQELFKPIGLQELDIFSQS
jgi:hydroxymethylbilane synthase